MGILAVELLLLRLFSETRTNINCALNTSSASKACIPECLSTPAIKPLCKLATSCQSTPCPKAPLSPPLRLKLETAEPLPALQVPLALSSDIQKTAGRPVSDSLQASARPSLETAEQ